MNKTYIFYSYLAQDLVIICAESESEANILLAASDKDTSEYELRNTLNKGESESIEAYLL